MSGKRDMFDYYEVLGTDAKLDAYRARCIRRTFPTYEEAKRFYDSIDGEVRHFLQDKSLIFRAANGKDEMLDDWNWRQGR